MDQAEVQTRKRTRLPKDVPNRDNIVYVTIDFNHQSVSEQLLDAGFDTGKSTIVTLEGVTQYISKAFVSTLQELNALTNDGAILFVSYVNSLLNEDPQACFGEGYSKPAKRAAMITKMSAKVGEPWISFYTPQEMNRILARLVSSSLSLSPWQMLMNDILAQSIEL